MQNIIACATSWIDTPYRDDIIQKGVGANCLSFVGGVYAEAGILSNVRPQPFNRRFWLEDPGLLLRFVIEHSDHVREDMQLSILPPTEKLFAGDLLLVSTNGCDEPNHAVFCERSEPQIFIIHADQARRAVRYQPMPRSWVIQHVCRVSPR